MKRAIPIALICAGTAMGAIAQNTPDTAPVPEENALPPAAETTLDEPELGADLAPPAEPLVDDPTLPGDNPIDPNNPAEPAIDPSTPEAPAADPGTTAQPPALSQPSTPGEPEVRQPPLSTPDVQPNARRQPLPDRSVQPLDVTPESPLDDPLREPIENEQLNPAINPGQPLPPDGIPPASESVTPRTFDPAYSAPAPPRVQPQIQIKEVVRDPIRIHDARLLVLMGHVPAATKALETLAHRFPTDPRVHYLRFYLLSRSGDKDKALGALQKAVALESLYPMTDYNRFMEPLQGPDRFYAERVRRAAAELASVDGLVQPNADDYLPKSSKQQE